MEMGNYSWQWGIIVEGIIVGESGIRVGDGEVSMDCELGN